MDQNSAPVRTDLYAALPRAMELATEYLAGLPHRTVDASTSYDEVVDALSGPLPDQGTNAVSVAEQLAATLGPATIACAGPATSASSSGNATRGVGCRLAGIDLGSDGVQPDVVAGGCCDRCRRRALGS